MKKKKRRGNCYTTSEAVYHLLGGKKNGWKPMRLRHEGDTHWFLAKRMLGTWVYLDLTASQFKTPVPYRKARGAGFLTKKPSKKAREMMKRMVWQ